MMQVINCKTCGNPYIGFNITSVTVNYNTTRRSCKCCNHTTTDTKSDFFCSIKCFEEYMRKELDKNAAR